MPPTDQQEATKHESPKPFATVIEFDDGDYAVMAEGKYIGPVYRPRLSAEAAAFMLNAAHAAAIKPLVEALQEASEIIGILSDWKRDMTPRFVLDGVARIDAALAKAQQQS